MADSPTSPQPEELVDYNVACSDALGDLAHAKCMLECNPDELLAVLFPDRGHGKSSEEEVDIEKRNVSLPSSEGCQAACSNSLGDFAHAQCLLNCTAADELSPDGKASDGVEAKYKEHYCNTKCMSNNSFADILCKLRCSAPPWREKENVPGVHDLY